MARYGSGVPAAASASRRSLLGRHFTISHDITDSYIHTEIGTINISSLSPSVTLPSISEPYNPQYRGPAVSSDSIWIRYVSENLVWLPSEYRPSCSVVSGNAIGIGVGSGKVGMCKVEFGTS
jgi:hypothetical protein